MGCMKTLSKIVLSIFNLIFLLCSILLMAFGIAAKANPNSVAAIFNFILPETVRTDLQNAGVDLSGIVVSNAVFMIVIGVIGIVIAGFGFFGACCSVRWLLVIYAILMILLLLGEIALIIFAAVYPETLKDFVQQNMRKTLADGFRNELRVNNSGALMKPTGVVELAWAGVQISERCCGAYNYSDYRTFTWNNTELIPGIHSAAVPISCCRTYNTTDVKHWDSLTPQSFINIQACLDGNPSAINPNNCFDAVKDDIQRFIRDYKGIAIGIAAAIVGLELILIIMAFIISHRSTSDKYA